MAAFFGRLATMLGLLALGSGLVLDFIIYTKMLQLVAAANSGRSTNLMAKPMPAIWLVTLLVFLGGLLLGLGLRSRRRHANS